MSGKLKTKMDLLSPDIKNVFQLNFIGNIFFQRDTIMETVIVKFWPQYPGACDIEGSGGLAALYSNIWTAWVIGHSFFRLMTTIIGLHIYDRHRSMFLIAQRPSTIDGLVQECGISIALAHMGATSQEILMISICKMSEKVTHLKSLLNPTGINVLICNYHGR